VALGKRIKKSTDEVYHGTDRLKVLGRSQIDVYSPGFGTSLAQPNAIDLV
jgi:hypothetical protein